MLDNELNETQANDHTTGGRGSAELTSGVPAALFQPPPVVFQPPAVRPEHRDRPESGRPESGRPEQAQAPARSQGPAGAPGSSGGDAAGSRRR